MRRESNYFQIGLTAFAVVAAILLFYDTLFGGKVLLLIAGQLLSAVSPILYGAFIAYMLAPMVNFFEEQLFETVIRKSRESGRIPGGVRALSMVLTWAVIFFFFYLLASVLLPELYKSVLQLVSNADNYYRTISVWVEHLLETNPTVEEWVTTQMNTYFEDFTSWLTSGVLPKVQTVMTTVSGGVMSVLNFFKNILVGLIVSVYFLAAKEHCAAYGRKLVSALFSPEKGKWVLRGAQKSDSIFSGFVRGKLLDSIIIGILCFVGCSILKFPYTPLVSVFVGVTNIIPFFGPFLGAIPSTVLIFVVDPMHPLNCVYFALFALALQQFDGNILGPKILGNSTGLTGFWVIFAITFFGGLLGVFGMIVGVPIFAVIYAAVRAFVNTKLDKKHLPKDTNQYESVEYIDEKGIHPMVPEGKSARQVNGFHINRGEVRSRDKKTKGDDKDK